MSLIKLYTAEFLIDPIDMVCIMSNFDKCTNEAEYESSLNFWIGKSAIMFIAE